mgnify:FL=1|jgi:hypothetical protein
MENTTTRISDLPQSNSQSSQVPQQNMNIGSQKLAELPNNYNPINVHPNPYGVSEQNPIMPSPEQSTMSRPEITSNVPTQETPQYLSEEQRMAIMPQQQQRLPSRHIPNNSEQYSRDEQIQPNYIPPVEKTTDYVREQELFTEKNIQKFERDKSSNQYLDNILTDLQVPLFVSILYFLFQLPVINTYIFKRFSFLSLYSDDGNFNLYGLLFKSLLFGNVYYTITKFTNFLISL